MISLSGSGIKQEMSNKAATAVVPVVLFDFMG